MAVWSKAGARGEGRLRRPQDAPIPSQEAHVFEKMRCQEATWADLGSIWGAKRLQNEAQGGSKSEMR